MMTPTTMTAWAWALPFALFAAATLAGYLLLREKDGPR